MVNIDYIMELLDWNKTDLEQRHGIALAKNVQSINVFLQPCNSTSNKKMCSVRTASFKRADRTALGHEVEVRYIAGITI